MCQETTTHSPSFPSLSHRLATAGDKLPDKDNTPFLASMPEFAQEKLGKARAWPTLELCGDGVCLALAVW
jgi:hypothetical protein